MQSNGFFGIMDWWTRLLNERIFCEDSGFGPSGLQCSQDQMVYRRCFQHIADLIVLTGRRAEQQTSSPDKPACLPVAVEAVDVDGFQGHHFA